MIKVTINGRELELERQVTILEAARQAGIKIPTLCNHEGLAMYGGCRLCLVEVEKMPRLQTACTLMVTDGMEVRTESEQISSARRGMLEFILTNHPLDCPFCDKAGECELQDLVYLYGATEGRFTEPKIKHPESNVDPILARNIERCIACTRCVRICDGVQGAQAIAMLNRGNHTVMEPFSGGNFDCEYCGNCLTVCPVGSILSRLYKESYRPWQVERTTSTVCGYCGVGCSFDIQVRDEAIKRVVPKIPEGLNRGMLCALGRFGYEYVDSPERLSRPLVRRNGNLEETSWEEALGIVARKLGEIKEAHGGSALAGIASPRCTNEDNYLFQKFIRGVLGSNNIDSTARLGFAGAQAWLEALHGQGVTANRIEGIGRADAVLIVGGDPTVVTPVLGLQVRAASRAGAKIISLDPAPGLLHFEPNYVVPKLFTEALLLEAVLHRLVDKKEMTGELPALEDKIRSVSSPDMAEVARATGISAEEISAVADALLEAGSVALIIGRDIVQRADGHRSLFLLAGISYLLGGHIFLLSDRPNEQGLIDMGCLPDTLPGGRPLSFEGYRKRYGEASGVEAPPEEGLRLFEMLGAMREGNIRGLYVMGENPVFNLPGGREVEEALEKLDFLVVQDIFMNETARMADVVLPALSWAEKEGTFTNLERRIQRVRRGVNRGGSEDWRIISELAGRMGVTMQYGSAEEIMEEISKVSPVHRDLHYGEIEGGKEHWPYHGEPLRGETPELSLGEPVAVSESEGMMLLQDRSLFQSGTTSRGSRALAKLCPEPVARIHPEDAAALGMNGEGRMRISSGNASVEAAVHQDDSVRRGAVMLSNHFSGAGALALMVGRGIDAVTGAPSLEGCAVSVEAIGPEVSE